MSEVDKAIDQIESHAALFREQQLRAEIERLKEELAFAHVMYRTCYEERERLRAALEQGNNVPKQGNLDGLITSLELIANQKGDHWSKGVARRALEGKG